jgi:hypothetical protein
MLTASSQIAISQPFLGCTLFPRVSTVDFSAGVMASVSAQGVSAYVFKIACDSSAFTMPSISNPILIGLSTAYTTLTSVTGITECQTGKFDAGFTFSVSGGDVLSGTVLYPTASLSITATPNYFPSGTTSYTCFSDHNRLYVEGQI